MEMDNTFPIFPNRSFQLLGAAPFLLLVIPFSSIFKAINVASLRCFVLHRMGRGQVFCLQGLMGLNWAHQDNSE